MGRSKTRQLNDFKATKKTTGGLTGSYQAEDTTDKDHLHQIKRPISQASFKRRLKADGLDRENFGEVIAAQIGRKLLDESLVPNVFLVYGSNNKGVHIASRYLGTKEKPAVTLDQFAKFDGITLRGKHVRIIPNKSSNKNKGEMSLHDYPDLKRDLCSAIALSAVLGDHDVNPGNMMVFEDESGKLRLARIDFGHAFNDLLKCSQINGGGVRDTKYPILDFFNRNEVGGVLGDSSKLWRDYPDLIPCQKMVDALRKMSQGFDKKVEVGIGEAKTQFTGLVADMEVNKDFTGISHVEKSLDAICPEEILGASVDNMEKSSKNNDESQSSLDPIFGNIQNFVEKQGRDLDQVANLMELQLAIDDALKGTDAASKITKLYNEFKGNLPQTGEKIHWIKTGTHHQAKICTIKEFVTQRAKELSLENPKDRRQIKNNVAHIFTLNSSITTPQFKERYIQSQFPDKTKDKPLHSNQSQFADKIKDDPLRSNIAL